MADCKQITESGVPASSSKTLVPLIEKWRAKRGALRADTVLQRNSIPAKLCSTLRPGRCIWIRRAGATIPNKIKPCSCSRHQMGVPPPNHSHHPFTVRFIQRDGPDCRMFGSLRHHQRQERCAQTCADKINHEIGLTAASSYGRLERGTTTGFDHHFVHGEIAVEQDEGCILQVGEGQRASGR